MGSLSVDSGRCLRWGFFGAGRCTHDFITALKLLPIENHKAVAIGSRDTTKAADLANSVGLTNVMSYLELAESSIVDIIYIGTVNSEHFAHTKLALENGKHVLCEKPMCMNYREAKELTEIAKANRVFLMEGLWTLFFPATKKLFEEIRSGNIGDIVHVVLEIGNVNRTERFSSINLGGGSLMNHGIYGIMMVYRLLGEPDEIKATGYLSETGVDESSSIIMTYKAKCQLATMILSCKTNMPGELKVIGTLGVLKLPFPFWAPLSLETPNDVRNFSLPKAATNSQIKFNNLNSAGFIYEAEEVRLCIQDGLLECPRASWKASLAAFKITDEIRRQLGVTFKQDF